MHLIFKNLVIATMMLGMTGLAAAQGGPGHGKGRGFGRGHGGAGGPGHGRRHGHDERHDEDREVFQFLLTNHQKIKRTVTELPNGVETLTESDDPEIAANIREHVEWMEFRIKETNPIRMRDPLFAEIFKHTDKIKIEIKDTEKGVHVIETSDDPYVAKLVKCACEGGLWLCCAWFRRSDEESPHSR